MPDELLELCCRDLHGVCPFSAQARTLDALMEVVARHAREEHGMRFFPPQWWTQMRRAARPLSDGSVELSCQDVSLECDYTIRVPTMEEIKAAYTQHAKERHGMPFIPEDLWAAAQQYVRTISA